MQPHALPLGADDAFGGEGVLHADEELGFEEGLSWTCEEHNRGHSVRPGQWVTLHWSGFLAVKIFLPTGSLESHMMTS